MDVKKVKSKFAGVLRIRSEPSEDAKVCGTISFKESINVENEIVASKEGAEYYKVVGGGYIIAKYLEEETERDVNEQIEAVVKEAQSAAEKANTAAKACEGIAAGINTMVDEITGKACELGMNNGNIVVKEA